MSYSCSDCPKVFLSLSKRDSHLRTHSGEESFSCNLCSKAFSNGNSFKLHLRIHSDKKANPSNQYPKVLSQLRDLKKQTVSPNHPP